MSLLNNNIELSEEAFGFIKQMRHKYQIELLNRFDLQTIDWLLIIARAVDPDSDEQSFVKLIKVLCASNDDKLLNHVKSLDLSLVIRYIYRYAERSLEYLYWTSAGREYDLASHLPEMRSYDYTTDTVSNFTSMCFVFDEIFDDNDRSEIRSIQHDLKLINHTQSSDFKRISSRISQFYRNLENRYLLSSGSSPDSKAQINAGFGLWNFLHSFCSVFGLRDLYRKIRSIESDMKEIHLLKLFELHQHGVIDLNEWLDKLQVAQYSATSETRSLLSWVVLSNVITSSMKSVLFDESDDTLLANCYLQWRPAEEMPEEYQLQMRSLIFELRDAFEKRLQLTK